MEQVIARKRNDPTGSVVVDDGRLLSASLFAL